MQEAAWPASFRFVFRKPPAATLDNCGGEYCRMADDNRLERQILHVHRDQCLVSGRIVIAIDSTLDRTDNSVPLDHLPCARCPEFFPAGFCANRFIGINGFESLPLCV